MLKTPMVGLLDCVQIAPLALVPALAGLASTAGGCASHSVIDLVPGDASAEDADVAPDAGPDADASGDAGDGDLDADLDADADADPDADADNTSLLHRYSFSEPGTIAYDSVGNAHGEIYGTTIPTTGNVVLDGEDDYVWLPDGLVSSLHSATFMIWATWHGSGTWQRLWDFGNFLTTPPPDMLVEADRTFFLTTMQNSALATDGPAAFLEFRGMLKGTEFGHEYLIADAPLTIDQNAGHHYAVVIDEEALAMALYIDGSFMSERSLQVRDSGVYFLLGDLNDNNNSIGRSQYAVDAFLAAEVSEFRIYGRALTSDEILAAHEAGPEQDPIP